MNRALPNLDGLAVGTGVMAPAALPASRLFPARVSPRRRRVLVVGLGSIGRRHARLLSARPDLAVEFCEHSAQAVALAETDVGHRPTFVSLSAALATRPDLVVIATPHALHAEQVIASMKAGADVLCEKPLCLRLAEAGAMIACARATGRKLGVGFQLHFHPGVQRVRDLIQRGAIGAPVHVHARVGSYITLRNSASRYQAALPGALFLDYAHQPDLIFWLLGRLPAAVTLTGIQAGNLPLTSTPNVMALTLEYGGGVLATVHLNYVQMPQRHEWEVVGDQGWILLDADSGALRLGLRASEVETQERIVSERDDTYRREHQAFLDYLDGLRDPESSAEVAARSVELFAMAMRSLNENRRITCEWANYA